MDENVNKYLLKLELRIISKKGIESKLNNYEFDKRHLLFSY